MRAELGWCSPYRVPPITMATVDPPETHSNGTEGMGLRIHRRKVSRPVSMQQTKRDAVCVFCAGLRLRLGDEFKGFLVLAEFLLQCAHAIVFGFLFALAPTWPDSNISDEGQVVDEIVALLEWRVFKGR